MSYREYQVTPVLRRYIDCVWNERITGKISKKESYLIVPDNTVELVITEGQFHRKYLKDNSDLELKSHLSCFKTRSQEILIETNPILSIRFRPEFFQNFSLLPLKGLSNRSLSPELIFGRSINELVEEITESGDMKASVKFINNYFSKKVMSFKCVDLSFEKAVRLIKESNGLIQIGSLASKLDITYKKLERLFLKKIGVTPKKYCQMVRFAKCVTEMKNQKNLTAIAYQNGYFDQTHFIKDFKCITGLAPSEYKKRNGIIQEPIFTKVEML